jgi:tRNA threonylcarbamoyladenosine biosynthesis protein TsaE
MKVIIHSEKEMQALAARFAKKLRGGEVLALVGELGAGKTTFTKGLAKALGVRAVVQSPTFLLMKCYPVKKSAPFDSLCHVDAYRIKSERELITIGLGELLGDPHVVTVIEWADRVKKLLPKTAVHIVFAHGKVSGERIVSIFTTRYG